jgi:hypothetical protein
LSQNYTTQAVFGQQQRQKHPPVPYYWQIGPPLQAPPRPGQALAWMLAKELDPRVL